MTIVYASTWVSCIIHGFGTELRKKIQSSTEMKTTEKSYSVLERTKRAAQTEES